MKQVLLQPLAELIRPNTIDQYIGQKHLFGSEHNGRITSFIRLGYLPSLIFYGPPGVGKTTIAKVVAKEAKYVFLELSATNTTVSELRELRMIITNENKKRQQLNNNKPLLKVVVFVDEIHRFSKSQQDLLLPYIEAGDFTFIGATTNITRLAPAILSRCQCIELDLFSVSDLHQIINRAMVFENVRRRMANKPGVLQLTNESVEAIASHCDGDARKCINLIELLSSLYSGDTLDPNTEIQMVNIGDLTKLTKGIAQAEVDKGDDDDISQFYENLGDCLCKRPPRHKLQGIADTPNDDHVDVEPLELLFEIKLLDDRTGSYVSMGESTIYDEFKHKTIAANDEQDFSLQMQVSDDSDLELEAEINDAVDLQLLDQLYKRDDYFLIMSNFYIQKLIQRKEPISSIIKYLMVFNAKYVNVEDSKLMNLVSTVQLLHHADVDLGSLLANVVEMLLKAPKSNMDDPIVLMPGLIEYWKAQTVGSKNQQLNDHFTIVSSPDWTVALEQNIKELELILKKREDENSLSFEIKAVTEEEEEIMYI